jgi:hypothetical protein
MTANIIQIMKHTVKASVLMVTTDHALYCCVAIIHPARAGDKKTLVCFYTAEQFAASCHPGMKTGPDTTLVVGGVFSTVLFLLILFFDADRAKGRQRRRGIPFYPQCRGWGGLPLQRGNEADCMEMKSGPSAV